MPVVGVVVLRNFRHLSVPAIKVLSDLSRGKGAPKSDMYYLDLILYDNVPPVEVNWFVDG